MRDSVFPRFPRPKAAILAAALLMLSIMAFAQSAGTRPPDAPPSAQNTVSWTNVSEAFARAGMPLLANKVSIIDFSLPLIGGKQVSLAGLSGKVVFLNFWATWCPPCRAEMPAMEKLYQRFKNDGLEFLAVNLQEDEKTVATFLKANGLNFPVALDRKGQTPSLYGVRGIPTTYVVDRSGVIIAMVVGGREWDSQAMMDAFSLLLQYGR